jgi:septum formation protein
MLAQPLILASSSPYRRSLLARLGLTFSCMAPDVDESERHGEAPSALAARLAEAKARAVAIDRGLVIGSDQVAELDGKLLRKPGRRDAALEQLLACQGKTVTFHTALCVIEAGSGRVWTHTDATTVRFAHLNLGQLERYVDVDAPFDCAGGFRMEGLGIALFSAIETTDPTALIGLPLIALVDILRQAGVDPLTD